MPTNCLKVLCHGELDWSPFCVYHPTYKAYAMYFSDEANPPKPELLGIAHSTVADVASMVWRPAVQIVGNPDEDVDVYGEYDDRTGEVV